MRSVARAAGEDGEARSVDGMAKAMGGAQVKKNMVLVVGATGTLGRQVGPCAFSAGLEGGGGQHGPIAVGLVLRSLNTRDLVEA